MRSGYPIPAVSGAHMWVEWLHNPYLLVHWEQEGDWRWDAVRHMGDKWGTYCQRKNYKTLNAAVALWQWNIRESKLPRHRSTTKGQQCLKLVVG